eukprot:365058-Chlamydomonas_euryale.AAC.4
MCDLCRGRRVRPAEAAGGLKSNAATSGQSLCTALQQLACCSPLTALRLSRSSDASPIFFRAVRRPVARTPMCPPLSGRFISFHGSGHGLGWGFHGSGHGLGWGLGVPWGWPWHGLGVPWVWPWPGLGVPWVWPWPGLGVPWGWPWPGLGVPWGWQWPGLGVPWGWQHGKNCGPNSHAPAECGVSDFGSGTQQSRSSPAQLMPGQASEPQAVGSKRAELEEEGKAHTTEALRLAGLKEGPLWTWVLQHRASQLMACAI